MKVRLALVLALALLCMGAATITDVSVHRSQLTTNNSVGVFIEGQVAVWNAAMGAWSNFTMAAVSSSGAITNETNYGHLVITNTGNGAFLELTTNSHINAADESGTRLLTGTNALFRLTNTTSSLEASNGNLKISGSYTGLASGLTNANGKALVTQTEIGTSSNSLYGILETDLGSASNINWTFANGASNTVRALIPAAQTNDTTKIDVVSGIYTNLQGTNLTAWGGVTTNAIHAIGRSNSTLAVVKFTQGTNSSGDMLRTHFQDGTTNVMINTNGTLTIRKIPGDTNILFQASTNGSNGITVTAQGFVGFGTNSPAQALDVIGNVNISGTLSNASITSSGQIKAGSFTSSGNGTINNGGFISPNSAFAFREGPGGSKSASLASATSGDDGLFTLWFGSYSSSSATTWRNTNAQLQVSYGATPTFLFQSATSNAANLSVTGSLGIGTTTPAAKLDVVGGINCSNIISTNASSIRTNYALFSTVASAGLHTLSIGKGWTNDLGARADIEMQVRFVDAVTGDPSLSFTNTATGQGWTNSEQFALAATIVRNIVIPDISTNDYGSLTDLSGSGASVTIMQAWWKLK